jgi:AcrR family transcriptional regulator
MSKGEVTRAEILRRSAAVFNTRGYFGTSLADVMAVTGLKKGGIYNHFDSKDELAVAAFDHTLDVLRTRARDAIMGKGTASEQLMALIDEFCGRRDDPPLPGGCPLLNTAVESDDALPALRSRVHDAYALWREFLASIITRGVAAGEFRDGLDPDRIATTIIINLEGAMALAGVFEEAKSLGVAREHLREYIEREMRR